MTFTSAIIAAGGRGTRFGGDIPKQLMEFGGVSILERAVETFVRATCIHEIIVALPLELAADPPGYLLGRSKPLYVVAGGPRRQDSVANAFERVAPVADVVMVHDAARPFASERLVTRVCDWFRERGVDDVEPFRMVEEDVTFRLPVELRRELELAAARPE